MFLLLEGVTKIMIFTNKVYFLSLKVGLEIHIFRFQ